ncbi:hypothetical protein [Bacillus sp. C28GYM-DRY-1]|nr:hypothetical protein [Bacillus sp. C28GYM-DRY-1]MDO3661892.1 hypothetical protein [Bacillus sp. C28GYM-DRY-1]
MELTLHAFFIYKIEGKTGVWDVKANTEASAAHVKLNEKRSKEKIEGG